MRLERLEIDQCHSGMCVRVRGTTGGVEAVTDFETARVAVGGAVDGIAVEGV